MYFRDLYRQWRGFPKNIRLFYGTDILFALGQAIFYTLFNLHLLEVGFTADHVGLLQSIAGWVMAAVAIPIGLAGDRFGRRRLYVTGSILYAVPYLIMPWLTDFSLLAIAFALGMVGNALMMVNEAPLLAGEVGQTQRASVFSFMMVNFFLWNTLGIKLSGYLTEWLPAGSLSMYQWPLVIAGACGLAAGLSRALLRFAPQPPAVQGAPLRLRPSRTTLLLLALATLAGAYNALFQNFSNVILSERFGFGTDIITTLLTIAGVVGFIGSLTVPWLSERLGDLRGYAIVLGTQGLITLLMGVADVPALYLPAFMTRAVLATMQMSLWSAFSMGITPAHERATANSVVMVGRNVGAAVASKVFGAAIAAGSFLLPFSLAGLCAVATMLLAMLAFRRSGTVEGDAIR